MSLSISQQFQDAQRRNLLLMEEVEAETKPRQDAAMESNRLFITIATQVLELLHKNEAREEILNDLEQAAGSNVDIFILLGKKDIAANDAALQSNALWVKAINKIRNPGEPVINTSTFTSRATEIFNQ